MLGTIMKVDKKNQFGIIRPDSGTDPLFFHLKKDDAFAENQTVVFEEEMTAFGDKPSAVNVRPKT